MKNLGCIAFNVRFMQVIPPYKPNIEDDLGLDNFDKQFTQVRKVLFGILYFRLLKFTLKK